MKRLLLILASLVVVFLLFGARPRTIQASIPCGECTQDSDCNTDQKCSNTCCVPKVQQCGGVQCTQCNGACGGGSGNYICRNNCTQWPVPCTNDTPCQPSCDPYQPNHTNCGSVSCPSGGNGIVYCCSPTGGYACTDSGRTCTNTCERLIACTTAASCPNRSISEQCGQTACTVGKVCTSNGQCEYYCTGTPPCNGPGGGGGGSGWTYTAISPSGSITTATPTFSWTTNNPGGAGTYTNVNLYSGPSAVTDCATGANTYSMQSSTNATNLNVPLSSFYCTGLSSPCPGNLSLAPSQTYSWLVYGKFPDGTYAGSTCLNFTPVCSDTRIISCGSCAPSCGAGTRICTNACGQPVTQSCSTTYFQTFGGDVVSKTGTITNTCLPAGKYITGN